MVRTIRQAVICLFLLLSVFAAGSFAASINSAGVVIDLSPSVTSPQYLGTSITWTATVHSPFLGHIYDYQFAVIFNNQYQIVRDFSSSKTFTWVPYTVEGTYRMVVNVRDITMQPYTIYPSAMATYVMLPWVTAPNASAVHPTSHPLVALFSGPPCQTGHTLRVQFHVVNSNVSSTTNSVACSSNSANFYVAGMLPSTQYLMHWQEYDGNNLVSSGADLPFMTGALSADYPKPTFTVNVPPTQYDAEYPVVYWEFFPAGGPAYWPTATDLAGNVLWYYPGPMFVARREIGGNFFTFPDDMTFREYDMAGNMTLETNVEILNEQLVRKGYPTMNDFNEHEARRLPNGNLLLLGSRDVVSTDHQGGTQQNPVDIIGDMILVLDHNMQLVWAWDSFAHDDLDRKATLNDQCKQNQGGCPKFNKNFAVANDWLHSNSVQLTKDGNLMLSERSQDYVIMVNYQNGHGDGSVLWRMGPYGDITLLNPSHKNSCGDPLVFPWFTHQHDAAYQADAIKTQLGTHVFTVFDDGNLRNSQCGGGQNSRGMLFLVNELQKTASVVTLADLGAFSGALGSGDLLQRSDGLFTSYGNGFINMNEAQSTEVDLQGNVVYQIDANTVSYRTYRMQDLYTPTLP